MEVAVLLHCGRSRSYTAEIHQTEVTGAAGYSNPIRSPCVLRLLRLARNWAAEQVVDALKEKANTTRSVGSRDNVFYFDGWDGLGASAVLRAIATPTSLDVKRALAEQVIHIDCSMWESRRALQKAVEEQLQLPDEVMKMFEQQDKEDDFRGVAKGSRAELQQVVWEIYQHTQKANRRLLVIFHNGSSEELDLATCCGWSLLLSFNITWVIHSTRHRMGGFFMPSHHFCCFLMCIQSL
ncbi:hypothetical protein SETIT_2G057900v2 [Setaria italica]|uniref:Uncharacterized protein n=1 Tax=Setaria italica TaxID=4555 RepID=A0A368PVX6_SETIT|nr:uncharacterized protein LOC101773424 [Setaria italica]RCV09789.1 hypothetical protein SETIT_2G057900v2 [Setaria italica]